MPRTLATSTQNNASLKETQQSVKQGSTEHPRIIPSPSRPQDECEEVGVEESGSMPVGVQQAAAVIVVLDTSVLIADPESIHGFPGCDLVIPLIVVEELDGHKNRKDGVGRAAREVVRKLEAIRAANGGNPTIAADIGQDSTIRVEMNGIHLGAIKDSGLDINVADNRIIAAALGLAHQNPSSRVRIVSADGAMRFKAASLGLDAEDYIKTHRALHSDEAPGWQQIELIDGSIIDALYSSKKLDLDESDELATALAEVHVNEYLVLKAGTQSALARRTKTGIKLFENRLPDAWGLRPKNKEQQFALDLLMDPDVPMVALSGAAGTGKTLLAVAAALEQTFEPRSQRYERIIILRPMQAVGGEEIGFLPGDVKSKLAEWARPVEEALAVLTDGPTDYAHARDTLEQWHEAGLLTVEPITFLRGRSLHNTFIIVDEAQNLELESARTILTRVGQGSKVVCVGDISQIDHQYVSARNSGLSVMVDAFAGEELFGHILLKQGERSKVADLAAERL